MIILNKEQKEFIWEKLDFDDVDSYFENKEGLLKETWYLNALDDIEDETYSHEIKTAHFQFDVISPKLAEKIIKMILNEKIRADYDVIEICNENYTICGAYLINKKDTKKVFKKVKKIGARYYDNIADLEHKINFHEYLEHHLLKDFLRVDLFKINPS